MRIVSIANQKGGAGKTTTVMNLASVCSENSRVLVVDVDPQGSSAWWADRAGDSLPFDVADDTDPSNLARLRELPYDVVFVDTPGSLEGRDVLSTVLGESDFVILPTEPSPLAFAPLMATINEVVVPAGVNYRVLVNRVDPRVPSDLVDAQGLLDGAGFARFEAAIRDYKIHKMAPIEGRVVTQYADGDSRIASKAREDYRRVALELVSYWANTKGGK
ncbi:ParA family protein [Cryobacterium melibiosiphilum]|uniref:ParA family protein n=1 Tax=Cryobacterium melibiosiphilum TaxID=995039 RepID=A0A3A5MLK7_9MICO|nr:ParA family protein [Cryobacterium melibiosiphilum]RJT90252.1 ParA family protein [Cryobacterium melibiosiphilum]